VAGDNVDVANAEALLPVADANANAEEELLPRHLVHEVFEYIHAELKNIIHREGNAFFDNEEMRLPLSLIMNSGLEDYFESVLLSERFKPSLCDECAKRGQLNSLIWARSKGCQWTKIPKEVRPSKQAFYAISGIPSVFISMIPDQLYIQSIEFSESQLSPRGACYLAARAGHFHILQWAQENDCKWDEKTCTAAAKAGHLHILQWARDNGCDWDSDTCKAAAKAGHWHIARWAQEHGCDCPEVQVETMTILPVH
jgi:hypothetical protein